MANSLGNYNEVFFAQEALIQLENALGIAGRIHRGYADDVAAKGDTIQIRGPGTFVVQDAPSTAQDVNTRKITLTLNQWKEVKFKLSDKELSLSANEIITDHIRPAAYAIANYMDQVLAALAFSVPYNTTASSTFALSDLTAARATMFDRGVPLDDSTLINGMVNGSYEAFILNALSASGMQPNQQDRAIRKGTIGELYGIQWFANQNTPNYTAGTNADDSGTVQGATLKDASTVSIAGLSVGGTLKKGDFFSIAGHAKPYAITADVTADGAGLASNVQIWPKIQANLAGGEVVTITQGTAGVAKATNLIFHRNFAALGTARLSTLGASFGGVRMASIASPDSQLSLRSRMYYNGDASECVVALDILFGYTMLDETLAQRLTAP